MHDPRLTPARPELAARYLEGKVDGRAIWGGEEFDVREAIAPLREGRARMPLVTEALMGERVTVYDRNGEGGPGGSSPVTAMSGGCRMRRW